MPNINRALIAEPELDKIKFLAFQTTESLIFVQLIFSNYSWIQADGLSEDNSSWFWINQ